MTLLSGDWIILLEKDGVQKHIFGLDFGLNTSAAKLFARDKAATTDVLQHYAIPHITHRLFLRPTTKGARPEGNWSALSKWFIECGQNVVCKPNDGTGGNSVFHIQTQAELEDIIQKLFVEERAIAVSPFVHIESEYRLTVLKGVVELAYEKRKSKEEGFKFNLNLGASAHPITDASLLAELRDIALNTANALGITFANVDIVKTDKGLFVLEVNSGVMFDHYAEQGEKERSTAVAVYEKALQELFFGSRA